MPNPVLRNFWKRRSYPIGLISFLLFFTPGHLEQRRNIEVKSYQGITKSRRGGGLDDALRLVPDVLVVLAVAPAGSASDFLISVRPSFRPSLRLSCDFHHSGGFLFIWERGERGGGCRVGARAPSIYLPPERNVFETAVETTAAAAGVNFCSVPLFSAGRSRASRSKPFVQGPSSRRRRRHSR